MAHPLHRVTAFEIVEPFVLNVGFDDRTQQQIDFRPVLHGELYGALRDAAVFERVEIDPDAHTLVWPNGADFDPSTLHDWPAAGPRMIELARRWADAERSSITGRSDVSGRRRVIGVDCATKDVNTGLALAASDDDGFRLLEATIGNFEGGSARSILEEWLTDSEEAALIAIDAPLGWPRPLAISLTSHSAGASIGTSADDMFRRATDVFVKCATGKRPLDVGADRIARTALVALRLLDDLRTGLGAAIPLAWDPADVTEHAAIEVYPAATLMAHGIDVGRTGYKKSGQTVERRKILDALRKRMTIPEECCGDLSGNADLLDAAVCVLAARDFITGRAVPPPDRCLAEHEGWIWTARREAC